MELRDLPALDELLNARFRIAPETPARVRPTLVLCGGGFGTIVFLLGHDGSGGIFGWELSGPGQSILAYTGRGLWLRLSDSEVPQWVRDWTDGHQEMIGAWRDKANAWRHLAAAGYVYSLPIAGPITVFDLIQQLERVKGDGYFFVFFAGQLRSIENVLMYLERLGPGNVFAVGAIHVVEVPRGLLDQ